MKPPKKKIETFEQFTDAKYSIFNDKARESILIQNHLFDIDDRLLDLEYKASSTTKDKVSTRAQQVLMLHQLGVIERLRELKIPDTKISQFLALLLNSSYDNIKKDLSGLYDPKSKLKIENNYEKVKEAFNELGNKDFINEVDKIKEKIIKKK